MLPFGDASLMLPHWCGELVLGGARLCPVTPTHALTRALKLMGTCILDADGSMSALDVALIGATGSYVLLRD